MKQMQEALCDAIDNALTCRIREPRFRVFIQGSLNYVACVKLASEWESGKGNPHLQLKEILGDGAVLSINQIATWSHNVRKAIKDCNIVVGKSALSGNSPVFDTYSFISSGGGYTPFGAHIDFEDSVIIDIEGEGREIRTWPVGSPYGELLPGSSNHYGISFSWEKYKKNSDLIYLKPGEVAVIKAHEPHIFHASGAGFFFGLSTIPDVKVEKMEERNLSDVAQSYQFLPINDDIYFENFINNLEVSDLSEAVEKIRIQDGAIFYSGRKVRVSEEEVNLIKKGLTKQDAEYNKIIISKLFRIGVFQSEKF